MALTSKTFSESNRDALRILMTAFYQASSRSRKLHAEIQTYQARLPLQQDFRSAQSGLLADTKGRFFAHLIEFAQHLRQTIYDHNSHLTHPLSKQFSYTLLAQNNDLPVLTEMIQTKFPQLIRDLRDEDVRKIILVEYTPEIMMALVEAGSKVVPIRPGVIIEDPEQIKPNESSDEGGDPPPVHNLG